MRMFSVSRCLALAAVLVGAGCAGLPEAPGVLPSAPVSAPSAAETWQPPSPRKPSGATQTYRDHGLRDVRAGTGFFVQADAQLLTNNHVVDKCEALSIETGDGREALARVMATDPVDDLALVKAQITPPAVATFREKVRLDGRPAAVIGYPSHGLVRITPAMVTVALSGPTTADGHRFALAGDIHSGNSGGPILDDNALVVGVIFARVDTVAVYQNTGRTVEKIGFAISNETVLAFLRHNGVTPATAETGPKQESEALFDHGRRFIGRVVCWGRER